MDKYRAKELLGLSDEEKQNIRREALKELDHEKYTDQYLDVSEISVRYFERTTKYLDQAKQLIENNDYHTASKLIETCILEYKTAQPEAYYLAAQTIRDKHILKKIIDQFTSNPFFSESRKLKRPMKEIYANL